jgi:dolichyl-phosphate beta-glucosyltransferase
MDDSILLVIPHYRDTDRLDPFLCDLLRVLPSTFAVLISDDGSGPEHVERLKQLTVKRRREFGSREDGARLLDPIAAPANRGKGAAVHAGWQTANEQVELLAFADSDGAVGATEILRAAEHFIERADTVDALIGSRIKILGRRIERRLSRHLSGRIFATLVSTVTGLPVYDSQCGFKMLKRQAYLAISPYAQSSGFAFDVELLLLLRHFGFAVEEFPVDWQDVRGSKVSFLRDPALMLADVIRSRRRVHVIAAPDRRKE